MPDSPTASDWSNGLRRRLDVVIDRAQTVGDADVIREAADLLDRLIAVDGEATALEESIASLRDRGGGSGRSRDVDVGRDAPAAPDESRPTSFLLLPASGEDSSRHFRDTVVSEVSPRLLDQWCQAESGAIASRIREKLAAWGLRDNTRGFPGHDSRPMIWDRIEVGTLALFAQTGRYVCAADVIGKCLSEQGSRTLWGSPEFRWMIFMTDIRPTSIPLKVVIEGAGFDPGYHITRQALVPREHREPGLWRAIRPYLEARNS